MFSNLTQKVIRRFQCLANLPVLFQFCAHNRKVLGTGSKNGVDAPIMLMELNGMCSAHIAYSYLAEEMAKSTGVQIKAYSPIPLKSLRAFAFDLFAFLRLGYFGVYRSFGVNEFIRINVSSPQKQKAERLFTEVVGNVASKQDVLDLEIDGVWIGDLVYDTYLKRYSLPTIDTSSRLFQGFLLESIESFVFWKDYLNKNDVRAISVSHCVYNLALPLRIGVHRGIDVFQINVTTAYRLDSSNLFAYTDFFNFRERFAELPQDVRKIGLNIAEQRILKRFSGEVGVDMPYSTQSAYGNRLHDRLLRESSKKKILIAAHCFFDSPHSYGKNLFTDFYEWLEFLGEISEQTDYNWYIKTHPDYLPGTKKVIDDFVNRFPKFILLPSLASHLQIIDEGIDVALTCYGTIGFEYAALGLPVTNASMNNPHIAYNFNVHARDIDHYRELLLNLNELELDIDKKEVYEYYFMKNIFNTDNLFFEDYNDFINEIGGYRAQFSPIAFRKWLAEWSPEKHERILAGLHAFIESKDFRMDYRHFGEEFTVANLEKFS